MAQNHKTIHPTEFFREGHKNLDDALLGGYKIVSDKTSYVDHEKNSETKDIVIKTPEGEFYKFEFWVGGYGMNSFTENDWSMATQVFPKQITTTIYE